MISVVVSLLVGMVLGQRFKVSILLPVGVLATLAAIVNAIAQADSGWGIALMVAAVLTSLQIGYLIGTGIRVMMIEGRAHRTSVPIVPLQPAQSTDAPEPKALVA